LLMTNARMHVQVLCERRDLVSRQVSEHGVLEHLLPMLGEHTCHGIAEQGDVAAGPWNVLVDAETEMTEHTTKACAASFGELREIAHGSVPAAVNRSVTRPAHVEDLIGRVVPHDDVRERGAARLRQVKEE